MCTRVFTIISVFVLSNSVTVDLYRPQGIISTTRIEIKSLEIECRLNDIVIISAPIIYNEDAIYHLMKPNGEVLKLNLNVPKTQFSITRNGLYNEYDEMSIKHINSIDNTVVSNRMGYKTFNVNFGRKIEDSDKENNFNTKLKNMASNEFLIGPLGEEDHGNWILSVYLKDIQDKWTELFQTITIEIIEPVPLVRIEDKLKSGDTLRLRFAYPISNLETCELIVPTPLYDRTYDRDRENMDKCGFIVSNITKADRGYWKIIGVGRTAYVGSTYVDVEDIDKKLN